MLTPADLSDEQAEYQVRDRYSFAQFLRFLRLGIADSIPDATKLWLFREKLANTGLVVEAIRQQAHITTTIIIIIIIISSAWSVLLQIQRGLAGRCSPSATPSERNWHPTFSGERPERSPLDFAISIPQRSIQPSQDLRPTDSISSISSR